MDLLGLLFLPQKVATLVRQGIELGKANDIVFKTHNSKHNSGAVGLLTNDLITRTIYYEHAAILALAPILNADLYAECTDEDATTTAAASLSQ